jgi:hypothetical protein
MALGSTLSASTLGANIGGVEYKDVLYPLQRIDIRGPAEHLILGKREPLEMQLVHKAADGPKGPGPYLIVSVLFWAEHSPQPPAAGMPAVPFAVPADTEIDFNPNMQFFVMSPPPMAEGAAPAAIPPGLNLGLFLEDLSVPIAVRSAVPFMEYSGSLTAPPCLEQATWLVRRDHQMASDNQVKMLASSLFALTANAGNFRHVMPLNKRIPKVVEPVFTPTLAATIATAPPSAAVFGSVPLPWGPEPRTDGEYNAMMSAKYALEKAHHTEAYTKDVAGRLAKAYRAYANELAAPPPIPLPPMATTPPPLTLEPATARTLNEFHRDGEANAQMEHVAATAKDKATDAIKAVGGSLRGQATKQAKIATDMIR